MDRKSPMEVLEGEHHVIQKMVGAMAVLAEGLGAGHEPPVATRRTIVEVRRTVADTCHHGKEETHRFPCLEPRVPRLTVRETRPPRITQPALPGEGQCYPRTS